MGLRKELARILTRAPRYSIHIYEFVMDALQDLEKKPPRRAKPRRPDSSRGSSKSSASMGNSPQGAEPKPKPKSKSRLSDSHVTGQTLCATMRDLAIRQYGMMAAIVWSHWGVRSTSDIGNVVYNLIEAGELQKNEGDSRSDFDDVFDFAEAFGRLDLVAIDDEV